MSEWREVKLKKVIKRIFSGGTPSTKREDYWGGELLWLSSGETNKKYISDTEKKITELGAKESSTKLAKKNSVVIASAGQGKTRGQVSFLKRDMFINQSIIAIEVDEEYILPKYLLFNLSSRYNEIRILSDASSSRGSITTGFLNKLTISVPNINTQKKIVNILSGYDELIENNNRRIQILEQTAEELYKEWFVRMRFPGYEKTKFDKGIPEGWEVTKIGDLFNVSSSKRVYSSDYVESGIPFYRSKEVIRLSNGESISDLLYISENKYMEFKRKFGVPNRNDILITSVGTIGIPLLITNDNPFYFKDGNLTWIQSSSNPFLSYYLYCWLKSDIGYQSLSMFTIGTSQSALTITNLKRLKLLLPDETLLYKFNNLFEDLNTKINNLNQQNQTLIKQRDLLLPRLMNGTITVK